MTRTYAAAPLSAPTFAERVEHDRRARLFAAHLSERYLVVSPHDRARVVEGYPFEPERDREGAMRWCLATVAEVHAGGGRLDVLLRDDGTLSPGCAEEVALWRAMGGEPRAWRLTSRGGFALAVCP